MAKDEQLPDLATRQAFGRTLRIWRLRSGWTQDTANQWGKAAKFPAPTDAVWNKLENAETASPTPWTFIQLATVNERLAHEDYGAIHDRKLKDRIADTEPIRNTDDSPWTATDFFSHFVGLKPPPQWADAQRDWAADPAAAERLSLQQREMFLKFAQDNLMDRAEAWGHLQGHCKGMSHEQVEAFKLVLGGHKVWSPAELAEMTDGAGVNATIQALSQWCDVGNYASKFRDICPG